MPALLTRWDPIPDELAAAIDGSVERLLAGFQITAPPIDALEIAHRMRLDASQTQRGRWSARRSSGVTAEPQVFKSQRAAALAIGRCLAGEISDRIHVPRGDRTPEAAVRLAAMCIPRLLLPTQWFREDRRRLGVDLQQLQARYATASFESVAWRLLDLEEPVIVTIFDNNHVVSRRANVSGANVTAEPAGAELAAQAYCHAYSRPRIDHSPGLTARAWPLHRADWRREIVVALLDRES